MVSTEQRIAEVIEASTSELVCQCDALHEPPPLGSVIVVRDERGLTYGITAFAETMSIDPNRRPVARGTSFASEAELYRNHPELTALLRTVFKAVIVAHHREGSRVLPRLPDVPPRVHAFVYSIGADELGALAETPEVVTDMVASRSDIDDDVIAATIRSFAEASPDPENYLIEAGRRLVGLMRGDPLRLQALIPKLRPSISP